MSLDQSVRILFVDDEQGVLDSSRRSFGKKYCVETSLSGEEALEVIRDSMPFTVIVSDLRMKGMDGLAFLKEARQLSPDSVPIILTGHADVQVAVKAVNKNKIFRFLTKPCPPKQMLETINDAIERHRQLLSMSTFTYTCFIENEKITCVKRNQGCLAVTGYAAKDFLADTHLWTDIILPEDRQYVRSEIKSIIAGHEPSPLEFRIHTASGSIRWIRKVVIPQRDQHGAVCRYDAMAEDVTEKKEIQQALLQSQSRYHRMVENIPGVVFQLSLTADGRKQFQFVSDSCKEILGIEPDTIMEDPEGFFKAFSSHDRAEIFSLMAQSAQSLTSWQWWGEVDFGNGRKLLQGLASPERLENGDVLWDGLMLDMTEQRIKEEQIRQLARLSSENPNPVLKVTDRGIIAYANHASDSLLRVWNRQLGQQLPERLLKTIMAVKGTDSHKYEEIKYNDRYYSIVFASIEQADYVNIYARDVTEVKRAEIKLIRANEILKEHDRLKSEFISTVSHEMRTPLCIFKNIVSNALAGASGKISHKLHESLKMADKSVSRLSRIISDFLEISKIESGKMKLHRQPIQIRSVVSEVSGLLCDLAATKGIKLIANLPKEEYVVNIDKDRIIQVLTNLIGNAIKFIPVNGTIWINIHEHEREIEVAVKDNGPGLTREGMERIFDRFVQIHQIAGAGSHGTGLGLAIAKELVEMHKGRIWAESALGHGCTFCFTLPKYDPNDEQLDDDKQDAEEDAEQDDEQESGVELSDNNVEQNIEQDTEQDTETSPAETPNETLSE